MLQASLKVIGGKNDGKVIEFKSKKFLVGREQDCHLRPNSDLVSRHHCVFTLDDYTLRLRDLGSTNGTLVNGRRIRGETVLTPGDVVRIGKLDLEVVIGSLEASGLTPMPHIETTSNASAMDTAFALPPQTTLEDSGLMEAAAPSSDTVEFQAPLVPAEDMGSDDAVPVESDTVSAGLGTDQTDADQPIPAQQPAYAQPPVAGYGPEAVPQGWQYPPGYGQYPQYQQYMPPGYPMAYPPGYPPGYGYPQQPAPYPMGGFPVPQGNPSAPEPLQGGSSSEIRLPDIRLPNPEDTGAKDVPKPAPTQSQPSAPAAATPSQRAGELLNASRRRKRDEDEGK